jgi:hypothetical protein
VVQADQSDSQAGALGELLRPLNDQVSESGSCDRTTAKRGQLDVFPDARECKHALLYQSALFGRELHVLDFGADPALALVLVFLPERNDRGARLADWQAQEIAPRGNAYGLLE